MRTSGLTRRQPAQPPATGPAARPWRAFAPRLVAWIAVLVFVALVEPDPSLSLMLMALLGVVTIVSEGRFGIERRLEAAGLPSREAWVPLAMLVVMALYGLVDAGNVADVFGDKGPVIAFILSFALVSEGLRRSGFFHYLAYRLTARGGGSTTRLILYLFLLSSALTYVTSNDIVVLTMTPIVVAVAYQARIGNAKLLLLSQFVAANTVSMGILIGSPTNLILGRGLDMGFVEYLFLMLAPSVMAVMSTFVFVTWVNQLVERLARRRRHAGAPGHAGRRLISSWAFSPGYTTPRFAEHQDFTPQMRHWVVVFSAAVVLLAASTATNAGLLAVAVVIAVGSLISLWRHERHGEYTAAGEAPTGTFLTRAFKVLPVGIVFFGLTYFVVADAVAEAPFVRDQVDDFVTDHASSHTPAASWGSIVASGALVNTINDLPASAVVGEILPRVDFETPFDRALVVQGALVGLNIATYVTPVGALAGIIWFDILCRERQRRRGPDPPATGGTGGTGGAEASTAAFDVEMPNRRDLVVYGSATFLVMTAVLGATNYAFVALADLLLGPTSGGTVFGRAPGHLAWTFACTLVVIAVIVAFRRVLGSVGVELAHLGDLLVAVRRLRGWAARHRVAFRALAFGIAACVGGVALYWSEQFHARTYGLEAPFDGPAGFVALPGAILTDGAGSGQLPQSALGRVLPATLALGAMVVVVRRRE